MGRIPAKPNPIECWGPKGDLTPDEEKLRDKLFGVVDRGQRAWFEVGAALIEIREQRLYRGTHRNFHDFCRERWGWNRRIVDQKIVDAKYVLYVERNERHGAQIIPILTSERQVRALTHADPDKARAVLDHAMAKTPGKLTAKVIEESVRELNADTIDQKQRAGSKAKVSTIGDRKRRAMQNRVLHNLRMAYKGLRELGVLDPFDARITKLLADVEQTFLVKGKL